MLTSVVDEFWSNKFVFSSLFQHTAVNYNLDVYYV